MIEQSAPTTFPLVLLLDTAISKYASRILAGHDNGLRGDLLDMVKLGPRGGYSTWQWFVRPFNTMACNDKSWTPAETFLDTGMV